MNQPGNMLSYFDMKYKYNPGISLQDDKYTFLPGAYLLPKSSYIDGETDILRTDPLGELMGQKRELLRSKIEMILVGIEERKKIKGIDIHLYIESDFPIAGEYQGAEWRKKLVLKNIY